jgi:GNAT superfamily N-acetyltransferase
MHMNRNHVLKSTDGLNDESRSDVEIRQLGATDAQAFSSLRRELTADNPIPMGLTMEEELSRSLEGFEEQLSYPAPNAAFGAFCDGELVGSAAVAWQSRFPSSRHKAILWGTFVSPRFRRRGLGRLLLEHAIAHASAHAVRRVNLTMYSPNDAAEQLYQSLGFVRYGVEPEAVCLNGVYHDGVQMSLLLGP